MNAIFVSKRINPRNASFFDFKLHCVDRFSNNNRHKAPGLSKPYHKNAPNDFAAVLHKTLDIAHLRFSGNFAALDLRKVLIFRPLGDLRSLYLLEFEHREELLR
jgi:hypothetical protein